MKQFFIPAFFVLAATAVCAQLNYPPSKLVDASDVYFGKTYYDPYRWLENLKDKEVQAWYKAQAELTDELLAKIPGRDALAQEWMTLDKLRPVVYSGITYENGRVFYKKTLGGENVGKLYFREGWHGAERLLFDPIPYKAGVTTTIQGFLPSWDGKHIVIGLSSGGAEWSEIRVLDVDQTRLLPESFYPSEGPLGWMKDNKSFFYDAGKVTDIKSPDIELNRKTKVHKLGTEIASDVDIFSDESTPEVGITAKEFPGASIDESYPDYIIGSLQTVQNELRVFYAPVSELKNKKIKWAELCRPSDQLVRGMVFYGDYILSLIHI